MVNKAVARPKPEGEVKKAGINKITTSVTIIPTLGADKEKEKPILKPVATADVEVETSPLTLTLVAATTAEAKVI
jgi:hypothetical protein